MSWTPRWRKLEFAADFQDLITHYASRARSWDPAGLDRPGTGSAVTVTALVRRGAGSTSSSLFHLRGALRSGGTG